MGEVADMMLDGTMDPETGEFNFDGEDGPGWPMTGAEAAEYRRATGRPQSRRPSRVERDFNRAHAIANSAFTLPAAWRRKLSALGTIRQNDAYHWQVLVDGKPVVDWWPHRRKFRLAGQTAMRFGDVGEFYRVLALNLGAST